MNNNNPVAVNWSCDVPAIGMQCLRCNRLTQLRSFKPIRPITCDHCAKPFVYDEQIEQTIAAFGQALMTQVSSFVVR